MFITKLRYAESKSQPKKHSKEATKDLKNQVKLKLFIAYDLCKYRTISNRKNRILQIEQ